MFYTPSLRSLAGIALTLIANASFANTSDAQGPVVQSKEFRYDQPYQAAAAETSAPLELSSTNVSASQSESLLQGLSVEQKQQHRETKFNGTSKQFASTSFVTTSDFWIYDSWLSLDLDLDYDGYYSKFTLEFDADTVYADAPVYAVIYLGTNDYYESIHVTSEFYIYGEDSSDSFVIASELIRGFPPRDYDVLIELYDAYSEQLVATADYYTDADLSYVSLESENYESVYEETVVIVEEHGGSTAWYSLIALIGVVAFKRFGRSA